MGAATLNENVLADWSGYGLNVSIHDQGRSNSSQLGFSANVVFGVIKTVSCAQESNSNPNVQDILPSDLVVLDLWLFTTACIKGSCVCMRVFLQELLSQAPFEEERRSSGSGRRRRRRLHLADIKASVSDQLKSPCQHVCRQTVAGSSCPKHLWPSRLGFTSQNPNTSTASNFQFPISTFSFQHKSKDAKPSISYDWNSSLSWKIKSEVQLGKIKFKFQIWIT